MRPTAVTPAQLLRLLLLSCVCLSACAQLASWKSSDRVLFPEQVEYLRMQLKLCSNENLILWGDGRCYKEFEEGPCYAGRVIVLDQALLQPYCKQL